VSDLLSAAVVEDAPPARRGRRRLPIAAALVVAAAAVVLLVLAPFGAGGAHSPGVGDNGYATSLQRIVERGLSERTQVGGTLGYAGDSTVRVPVGTAPTAVGAALASVAADRRMLASARASLAADRVTLADASAVLAADQQRLAVDCAGDSAAQSASAGASDAPLVSGDLQAQAQAGAKVAADGARVSTAEQSLAGARTQLASARAQETAFGQGSTFTALPLAGRIIRRGRQLYAIDGQPVLLLFGSTVARRAFVAGMSGGPDVAELNRNLDALGYGRDLAGGSFTAATAAAISRLQRAHGMSVTGALLLGSVVFEPGAARVEAVAPSVGVGAAVTPGPLMTVSSVARVVTIALDTAQQGGAIRLGDPVIITLPDNTTTPGRISYISRVATAGQNGTTIRVDATPSDPAATGMLDQAPVDVEITTATVRRALVLPVNALLSLADGGYAVEEVSRGRHHLVAVSTGLFDDADGLVQVSGSGLAAGQRVVVPGS
jgi:peptidoglycan hydrolase-like protein with peptidoglycan-binding domain